MDNLISRQAAIDALKYNQDVYSHNFHDDPIDKYTTAIIATDIETIVNLPSVQPEEVIPHRNYQYLSDYWCECGWHLGKKESVKYCAECGKKVKWDG